MSGVRLGDEQICPDMAACREHIRRIAPWDMRLYEHVRTAFAKRLYVDLRTGGGAAKPYTSEQMAAKRAHVGSGYLQWRRGVQP